MYPVFNEYIDSLESSFQRVLRMGPVTVSTLPRETPESGIYLFSENEIYLYVGRSNSIRKKLQNHCRPSSGHGNYDQAGNDPSSCLQRYNYHGRAHGED